MMRLIVVRIATTIELNEQQRKDLTGIAPSRALPVGYVFRAKLILMLSEGATFGMIRERLGTTTPTIIRWKERFLVAGIHGLDTSHPGSTAVSVNGEPARQGAQCDA
jgi:hypothetical protein